MELSLALVLTVFIKTECDHRIWTANLWPSLGWRGLKISISKSQNAFFAWMAQILSCCLPISSSKGLGPVLVMYHLYLGEEFMVNYRVEIHYGCSAHTALLTTSSFQIVFSFQVGMTINQKLNVFRIKAAWIGCNCYFRTNTLLDA